MQERKPIKDTHPEDTMTTLHLGVEELIARQQNESVERSVRHAWHLTEFLRRARTPRPTQQEARTPAWAGELIELSITKARWALL